MSLVATSEREQQSTILKPDLITLNELGRIVTGRTPPTKNADCFGTAMPFVTPGDMHQGRYVTSAARGLSGKGVELLQRIIIPEDSICVGCIGWQMGEVVMTSEASVTNQQINTIIPNTKVVDPHFLYYSLKPRKQELLSLGSSLGTRTPILKKSAFAKLKIALPPLSIQRQIANVLAAYDDLIENNRRRIQLLEESARLLYKEWFVHLRFPGHEHVKITDGVPEGWRKAPLGDVTLVIMGNSPKGDTYNDNGEGMPLVNGPVEFGECFTKRIKWTTKPTRVCRTNDLVVCVRGSTTGRNVKSDGEYCLGRGVCAISGSEQSFVDEMFKTNLPGLLGLTTGSTFPSWPGPILKSYPVLWPPTSLRELFESNGSPAAKQIYCLHRQNERLTQARDLLLPRLMNGEVAV